MEQNMRERPQSLPRTLYYWVALMVTLLVVDDMTFGWAFWAISQFSLLVSAVAALAMYWVMGFWITLRGLDPQPGRIAGWFLRRLQLGHNNPELHDREERLRAKVTSVAAAAPMTLLFGGVFTTLWLRRRGLVDDRTVKWLAFWLSGLFALEVAAIHAVGIGGLILFVRHHV